MLNQQELISVLHREVKPNFPTWLDGQITQRIIRYADLTALGETNNTLDHDMVASIESVFPLYVKGAYSAIQSDLSLPTSTSTIMRSMDDLEFRLLTLELARGINNPGWKMLNGGDNGLTIIAHPGFKNAEDFSSNLFQANRTVTERIKRSKIAEEFGVDWKENDNKGVIYLVEDDDVWQVTGTTPLKGTMTLWWVRELGDGISLYYTKGRNLDTPTMLSANKYHEFVHKLQKKKLSIEAFNTFFREFSLLEGMANWWEGWIVRQEYKEKDFLEYYLTKDRFMSSFLTSGELTAREGHSSLRYPWNTILTGMVFQKVGFLIEAEEQGKTQLSEELKDFNYEQVQKGLRFISTHLDIANEFNGGDQSLTEWFLEELCKKELGVALGYKQVLADYDLYGYDYAYGIVSKQGLSDTEKTSLAEQVSEHQNSKKSN